MLRPSVASIVIVAIASAARADPSPPARSQSPTVEQVVAPVGSSVASDPAAPGERWNTPLSDDAKQTLERYRSARSERLAGWVLTGLGLASVAAGVAVLAYGLEYGSYNQLYDVVTGGAVSLAVGVATAVPGIALSLHGQQRLSDAEWKLRGLLGMPFVTPIAGGAVAGATFRF